MTEVDGKLEKVYVNLWEQYHSLSLLGKTYTIILLDVKTWKTWVFYQYFKDKFMNVF